MARPLTKPTGRPRKPNDFVIDEDIVNIIIDHTKHGYHVAKVNLEDFHKVKSYRWGIRYNERTRSFYAVSEIKIDNKRRHLSMSRIIVDCPEGMQVDHKDHDTLNNTKDNLRICTNKENQENRSGCQRNNNSSGVRGVTWRKERNLWRASVTHNKKRIHVGYYKDIKEAEIAVIETRKKLFKFSYVD